MGLRDFLYPPISALCIFSLQNQTDKGGYGFVYFLCKIDICQFPLVTGRIQADKGGYGNTT